ncbi:MAG: hypothetical protein Ct9H90mP6_07110 [Gammaproteobacteria bacterium]|nr:MAG: hypothetical protein Ct9H90mP6_07110 [Gammaproteobacteria bacterium]
MIGEISHFLVFSLINCFLGLLCFSFFVLFLKYKQRKYFCSKGFCIGIININYFIFIICLFSNNRDFSMAYIASHSNSNFPNPFYKVTSIWSAHEGSLFLWVLIISLWGLFFLIFRNLSTTTFYPQTIGIISLVVACFPFLFLLFISSPFERILPFGVPEGS